MGENRGEALFNQGKTETYRSKKPKQDKKKPTLIYIDIHNINIYTAKHQKRTDLVFPLCSLK